MSRRMNIFATRLQPPAKNAGFELLAEHFVVPSTCLEGNETRWSHLAVVVATKLVVKHLIKDVRQQLMLPTTYISLSSPPRKLTYFLMSSNPFGQNTN